MSRRVGAKNEQPHAVLRFSRKLLVASALFLIIVSVFNLI